MIDSGARAAPEPKPKRATKDGHSSFFGPRRPSGSLERNISENLQFRDLSWSRELTDPFKVLFSYAKLQNQSRTRKQTKRGISGLGCGQGHFWFGM